MKILKVEINEREGYSNPPDLIIHVDSMPDKKDARYQERPLDNSTLYWSEHEDVVSFMCHSPANERGYGGSVFNITMQDGTTRSVKGPWSSRCGVMNNYFPHSFEVTIIPEDTGYRLATAILLDKAKELVESLGRELIRDDRDSGDISHYIR